MIELVLIRIETADGLVGWGEAFGHRCCATSKAAFDSLVAPLVAGIDTADIDNVATRCRRALYTYGLDGPIGFALSGLDIALWDLRGQRSGMPVYRLLGGSAGSSVPAYASLLRYGDADRVGEAAADAVRRGFRSVKLHEATIEAVAAARAAVGPDVALSLDVNCRWTVDDASALAKALEPYDLEWIEEPCWPPDAESLARVAGATSTPVAAGENAGSLAELERLAAIGKLSYLQPSAAKLGGLSGLIAAGDIAIRHGARLATHSAYFGPGLAATLQFCAARQLSCEWYDCRLERSPSGLLPHNGRLTVPDVSGLGVSIAPDLIDRFRVVA